MWRFGRIRGVDDCSLEAVVTIATEQPALPQPAFLSRVVTALPYSVELALTNNACAFTIRHVQHGDRSTLFEQACRSLEIVHHLLRPRRAQSNGKVKRLSEPATTNARHFSGIGPFGIGGGQSTASAGSTITNGRISVSRDDAGSASGELLSLI
jgi:hypothetical protein